MRQRQGIFAWALGAWHPPKVSDRAIENERDRADVERARMLLERSRRVAAEDDLTWFKDRFREASARGWL